MEAPVTGEFNSTVVRSESYLTRNDSNTTNAAEHNLMSSRMAKTSNPQPHVPCDSSSSKHRISLKPTRLVGPRPSKQKEKPPPKINIVVRDASGPSSSLQKKKAPTKRYKAPVQSSPAWSRAMDVQSSLGAEFPSCIKTMSVSQVTSGFWLGIPLYFCKSYLPKEDAKFVLEDENGDQFIVTYISYKNGISAGWKYFVLGHKLMEGDVLLFHLVEPTKFKVYIFKANVSSEEVGDAPVNHLNLESHSENITPATPSPKLKKNKRLESPASVVQNKVKKHRKSAKPSRSMPATGGLSGHLGNDDEKVESEVLECSRTPKPNLSFQEVTSFEDFRIEANGISIERELPDSVRMGYYKLCFDKKQFLHDGLQVGLSKKLVAAMIDETVKIGNEIKECNPTTTKEEFEKWDNSLKSLQDSGMKVGFLRDKLRTLATLVFESEGALATKMYVLAKKEYKRARVEASKALAKLKEVNENAEMLKWKVEKHEQKFKEEVNAPW